MDGRIGTCGLTTVADTKNVEATTSIPKESIKQKARTSSTSSSSSSSSSDSEKEKGSVEAENSKEHGLDKDISVSETIRVTVPSERVGVDSPDFNRYNDSDATTKELSVESQIQIVGPAAMEFSTFLKSPGAVNKNASDSKPFVKELEVSSPEPIRTPDIQPMLSPFELESVQLSEDQQSLKVETNIQSPQEKELRLKTTDIQPSVGLEAPKFGDNSVDISTDVQSTNIGASVECPAVQDSVKTDINSNQHSDAPTKESTISPDTVAFLRSMTDSETEFFDAPEIVASKSLTAQCSPPRYNIDGQEGDNDRQTPPSLEVSVSQDNDGVPSHLPVMPSCRIGSPKIRSTDSSERELRGDDKPPTITIDGIPNDHETSVTQPTSPEIQMSVRPKTKIGDDKKSEIAIGHSPENKREELSIKTNNGDRSFTSSSSNSLSSNDEIKQHEGDDVISVSSDEIIDHIQRQDSALSETEDETSFMTADTSVQHVDANFKVNTGLEVSEPVIHARTVSGTNAEIHKVIDKLDEIVVRHSDCVSVDSGTSSGGRHHGHFVVVAIDFGTTFSGYGFSFTRDPDSIHMMRKWEGGDPGVINQKTPTTMLLTPDGTFHSFGFSARNYYHDLEPKESKKWLYFEKFKMILHHKQDLCKDTKIKASNGKPFPALMVFSYALRFFKEKALNELSDQSGMKIINEDIRWVITVPAIWKEPAKQFMRRAAYEAGIVSPEYPEQLLVALEPEAASIYCRKLRMYQLVPDYVEKRPLVPPKDVKPDPLNLTLACEELSVDGNEAAEGKIFEHSISYNTVENLVRGSKYMVVDCGGGTVDITVHELDDTGKLRELHKATGGPYGSMGVDLKFERLLCDIFGNDYIEKYKNEKPAGWVDLMIAFESRKQAASPFKTTPLNVSLPFSFIDHYKKTRKGHVDKAIKKYGDKEIVWSYDGMLRLSKVAMSRLFDETIEKIKEAVAVVLEEPDCKGLRYIFLVGGFSESPVLQDEMRQKFGHLLKVIIPRDTSMSVLKGAVMFGIDPTIVHVRRSRLTYGVGILNRYNKEKHPKENLVRRDSIDWCTNVFDKFVVVDQSIALGDVVVRSYTPARAKQKTSIINIYCSDKDTVSFITDPGVRKCGTLCLDIASLQGEDQRKRREIKTKMFFGDTEIKVSATDVSSGKCVRASIDFLNK